jgi:hypothetical protein
MITHLISTFSSHSFSIFVFSSTLGRYGCDHKLSRFTPQATIDLRPETKVKNLYLTGQDVFTCGFAGASFGGLLCASSILKRNLYEDLMNLKKVSPPSIPK